jgi:Zn-finger nucleic acid-binding protein
MPGGRQHTSSAGAGPLLKCVEPKTDVPVMAIGSCPRCGDILRQVATPGGSIHQCPTCTGHAFTASVAKKATTPQTVTALLVAAASHEGSVGGECPWCALKMREVSVPSRVGTTAIDVCTSCQLFWLDRDEASQLPSVNSEFVETPRIAEHTCRHCGAPSRPDLDAYCKYCDQPMAPVRTPGVTESTMEYRPRVPDPDEHRRSDSTLLLDGLASLVRALLD